MKKKILIFIDWYLPGYKAGGPIQSIANLVDHLKDEFDFLIVTRDTDYCETIPYTNVKSDQWNEISGVSIYYFSQSNLTRGNIRNLLKETEFDFLYLNGIFSLFFTLIPLFFMRKQKTKPVIIAARGMFAKSALDVKRTKKKFFMWLARIMKLYQNVTFHATNEIEKLDILKTLGNVPVKIAGNLFQKEVPENWIFREKKSGTLKLVNVARIAPEKNLLYALQILRQVKEEVSFDFYGPVYDQDYWTECKCILDQMPSNIRANYKGSIESSKVLGLLSQYHVMFMPTAGENFGHIILQSLSSGCPVIISNQTPWRNLEKLGAGWDLGLENPELFVDCINKCARMDQTEYNSLSQSAHFLAKRYCENSEIVQENKQLFT